MDVQDIHFYAMWVSVNCLSVSLREEVALVIINIIQRNRCQWGHDRGSLHRIKLNLGALGRVLLWRGLAYRVNYLGHVLYAAFFVPELAVISVLFLAVVLLLPLLPQGLFVLG